MRKKPTNKVGLTFQPHDDCLYLAFFKPYDVVSQFTSNEEQHNLSEFGFPPLVYALGRLDSDSEGLLVLSDDTRLNNLLLNPVNEHARTYLAQVENIPSEEALNRLRAGVMIKNQKTKPCKAELLDEEPDLPPRTVPIRFRKNIPTCWIRLTLTEGKNRQVRRMTAAIGHPTLRLVRWSIGGLALDSLRLEPGQWHKLDKAQVISLFQRLPL